MVVWPNPQHNTDFLHVPSRRIENPGSGSVEENYRLETEYWQLCVQIYCTF
jgi:hypothetical protein